MVGEQGQEIAENPPAFPTCLNCGCQVERNYCPNCGQHIASYSKGLWQLIQEFLEEFIRFDSKLLRTVVPLVTKPGFLTLEWANGKRMRYITPLKLYVTVSALCFLVLSLRPEAKIIQAPGSIADLRLSADNPALRPLIRNGLWQPSMTDPKVLREHMLMHLPTASLLLIPITALIFSLLYMRGKRYYVEHLVFVLHYDCFCYLSFGFAALISGEIPRLTAFLWSVGYLLFAMKRTYGQGWLKTFLKFAIFGCIYLVLIIIAMFATAVVSERMASLMHNAVIR